MSKAEKIKNFDPNSLGDINNNIYGLPFSCEEADTVVIPVPWEVTVSYGGGTVDGPQAVYEASYQVDLFDANVPDAWKMGIAMEQFPVDIQKKSYALREQAEIYIQLLEKGESYENNAQMAAIRNEVNAACQQLNAWVNERASFYLDKNKTVALLGGDHSTPLGLIQALAQRNPAFGILQIDAHADLRDAYEGFEFSHASIMFNALKVQQVKQLVQVGIRDYCQAEAEIVQNSKGRVKCFYDRDIKKRQYDGDSWATICKDIVNALPDKVYLSFDIDGLDPKLCPHTGTPVAGGFEFEQVLYLIEKVVESGREIIAFDINEIAPGEDEWDANVGARLLYRISNVVNYARILQKVSV